MNPPNPDPHGLYVIVSLEVAELQNIANALHHAQVHLCKYIDDTMAAGDNTGADMQLALLEDLAVLSTRIDKIGHDLSPAFYNINADDDDAAPGCH